MFIVTCLDEAEDIQALLQILMSFITQGPKKDIYSSVQYVCFSLPVQL